MCLSLFILIREEYAYCNVVFGVGGIRNILELTFWIDLVDNSLTSQYQGLFITKL